MESERNVFEIQGLECAYDLNMERVVLQIENLSIPMGKVTIILGLSGSGKSTLIETLGLMNDTIGKGAITYHHHEGSVAITKETWRHPSALAEIRSRHFSFIFQNDFLMPYYTPEENIMIGRMIQGADNILPEEKEELQKLCQKMGLNFAEINRKMPSELSVGQRQRLSFIRAVTKNYSVIFGDEPTGNLDEINSELLMDVLNESISQDNRRSAILVSHNISMSVAKAGYIIVLSAVTGEKYEIRACNVFSRFAGGWINGYSNALTDNELEILIRETVCEKKQLSALFL
jgi:ABC-type lipoprotein export system ATPase subunit